MSEKPTIDDMMAAYAADAVDHANTNFGIALDYSPESVQLVEQLLGRLYESIPRGMVRFIRKAPSEEVVNTMCKMYGGYIGEVFRRVHGGKWEVREDLPGATAPVIALSRPAGDSFFPPSKVSKRLKNGDEDNVWHYYQVLSSRATQPAG